MEKSSIRYLKGIGPKREKMFNKLGIYEVKDFLYYFPLRYEDRREVKCIRDLKEDEFSLVRGKVLARNLKPFKFRRWMGFRRKNSIFEIALTDGSGIVFCVWFNQAYLNDYIRVGDELLIYGKLKVYKERCQFVSPEYDVLDKVDADSLNLGRIVGFYRLTKGLNQKTMRKIIYTCWSQYNKKFIDSLPFYIRKECNISNIAQSLKDIHFPPSLKEAELARTRFIFEELFFSQILVYLRKAKHRLQKGISFKIDNDLIEKLKDNLSFELTSSQEKVIEEIFLDLRKPYPMHRLLQGDVGCGKTIVACFAIAGVVKSGWQVAFMVPTEVLAFQHLETLKDIFRGFNFKIKVLVSSLPKGVKDQIYQDLKEARVDVILGTHSLIEETVTFKNLGLVIIDEQHKFGVAQRILLPKKGKSRAPHCLVMSATPIPRSLALSLYGDLDLSLIKKMPPERKEPKTIWIGEDKRFWIYNFLRQKIKERRQAYIIYPVIEESEDWDLKSLKDMYEVLKREFSEIRVEIFHGKMKSYEKETIIKEFREGKINILISTTIIEVGLNIENATVMAVENPERFGLAQLHQLRGRIRRSNHQPFFILISKPNLSENAKKRLEIITNTTDGFIIAEEDLKLRGPGDFFGNLQAGYPQLRIANPLRDLDILKGARSFAYRVIKKDPYLQNFSHRCIRDHLDFWFKR